MSSVSATQPDVSEVHLVGLLELLSEKLELPEVPREAIRAAVSATVGDSARDRLLAAGDTLGLRLRSVRLSVRDGVELARPDAPMVALRGGERGIQCAVFNGRSWGRARVTVVGDPIASSPVYRSAWPALLGAERLTDVVEWLVVEPAFPAGGIRTSGEKPLSPTGRLRGLIAAERRDVGVILVYAVATGVLALATPLAIQVLITWLAFGALLQPIVTLAGVLLVFLGFAAVLRALQRHAVEIVQRRLFVRLLRDVSGRLARVRVSAFDKDSGQELVNRFFDVLTVQKAVAALLVDGASAALQAIVGLALLGLYHPVLLVFDVVVITALALVLGPLGRGATKTAVVESKRKYEAAAWMEELARHPTTIKLGGSALAERRTEEVARAYLRDRSNHFAVFFRQYVGMLGVQVLVQVALLLLCGWLVLEGQLTVGQLVAAEFIVAAALNGFGKVVSKLDTWYDLHAAVDKLGTLADLPQERQTGLVPSRSGEPAPVALSDVTYGSVRGLSLELEAGERRVMMVSPDSRMDIADLVTGLRSPESGVVRRDGRDLRSLRPAAAHSDVALVRGTEPLIASVRDNVALARAGVHDGDVWDALARVGLADRIASLSAGLDTTLGPLGRPLCPDEVARLLFARALCQSPRLMVVDGILDGVSTATRDHLLGLPRCTTLILTVTGLPGHRLESNTISARGAA